jgi:LmbE family N-acetylglucosaminyl deacetylase
MQRLSPLPEGDITSVLAVVAHPDDLEYGAAAAIARWTSDGKRVAYVLATSGEAGIDGMPPEECGPLREEEERRSAAVVGVDTVEFLGHHDGVVEYGLALRRDIAREIRRHRPELVLTLNRDLLWPQPSGIPNFNMADHRNVGLAVLDAARDAANRWIFQELLDEGLEPWQGTRWVAFCASPRAGHAIDVTGYLDRGVASLREHRAYIAGLGDDSFDPDTFLRTNAVAAGQALGVEHAVSVELIAV